MGGDDESSSKRPCLSPRHPLYPVDVVYYNDRKSGKYCVYVFAKQVGAHLDPDERRKLVVLEVTGWMPYMFLKVEDDDVQKMERTVREFLHRAHQSLQDAGNIKFKRTIDTSSDLKFLDGYGYRPDDAKERFIKVSISDPNVYRKFAQIVPYKVYMAQVDHVCQFIVDVGLAHPDKLLLLGHDFGCVKDDPRILHLKTSVQNLSVIDSDGKEAPTLKAMSIAIKCTSKAGGFPKSQKNDDSIIQITSITTADVLRAQQGPEDFQKCVFVLGSCDSIDDADVRCYDSEERMLEAFQEHVVSTDPDIVTGYKVRSFDWPYILDRLEIFDVWAAFSRRPYGGIWYHHFNDNKEIVTSHDRILLDMCDVVKNERSLRSGSLNNIVETFLPDEEPLDVLEWDEIKELHEGTAATRAQLARHGVRCALVPLKLMIKLNTVMSMLELSNITGVPMRYVYERGKQVRVMTLIAREAKIRRMLFPANKKTLTAKVQGGKVLEPRIDYYNDPVCTLDFASMYPSIIIAMNLCYCTLRLHPQQQSGSVEGDKDVDEGRYKYRQGIPSPEGDEFEPESVRKGLLPTILVDLLNSRKQVKQHMAKCEDPFLRAVLNERQLAIKKCANSVYGFTGATKHGIMPCVQIARSVTAYGRSLMDYTIRYVEKHTEHKVIYGDTDSVMILCTGKTVAQAMQMGKELTGFVSSRLPPPITLEFEKVYKPYLLVGKKRYAGAMYSSSPDSHEKVDVKGLASIRRDCLPYAARIMDACIQDIVVKEDIDAAEQRAKEAVYTLRLGHVDVSELTLTKTYSSKESKMMQPHAYVNEKRIDRGEEAAKAGDRIPYVICEETEDKTELRREYKEQPERFINANLRKVAYRAEDPQSIDYAYYEKQLIRSLNTLFKPMGRVIKAPDSSKTRRRTKN